MHKGKPIHQVAEQKYDESSFKNFPKYHAFRKSLPFFHRKSHGISNGKHERRKHKICRCKTIPMCMKQGRISSMPIARRINDDHKTNRHSPENIESDKTLVGDHM